MKRSGGCRGIAGLPSKYNNGTLQPVSGCCQTKIVNFFKIVLRCETSCLAGINSVPCAIGLMTLFDGMPFSSNTDKNRNRLDCILLRRLLKNEVPLAQVLPFVSFVMCLKNKHDKTRQERAMTTNRKSLTTNTIARPPATGTPPSRWNRSRSPPACSA